MKSLSSLIAVAAATLPVNQLAFALTTSRIRRPSSSHHHTSSSSTSTSTQTQTLPQIRILGSTVEGTIEKKTPSLTPDNNNNNENNNLSPFLQGMVDEQRELQMNVGKAMDVLRKDYPYFLKRAPDYSIYNDSITLKASDGQIQLSKLSSYKKAFGITRTMLGLLYDPDRSVVQSRMVYDSTRTQIRVSFNAMLVPKRVGGALALGVGVGRTVHVDGISVYSVDVSSSVREDERGNLVRNEDAGKIVEHRIEKLLVNGAALQPPYFNAFGLEMITGQHAGALAGAGAWS